jgi:putative molybdopterin biosynthesis protein
MIKKTLVVIGSHDLILDVLADMLPSLGDKVQLGSTHVGSMGGIMSLNRQETHLAPIHLLDENTGVYNIPYLQRVVTKEPMALIKGVGRIQGLIVKKGKPKKINDIKDIVNSSFVNRQRGSGTRILLDYKLKELGINKEEISGYLRESITHMAVAALVDSDSADTGLGILAAAKAFNLDFVDVAVEEYDFAIPVKFLELPQVKEFIKVLQSQGFKDKLEELGGYTYERIGEVVKV